jgi:hypothetical protein
MVAAMRGLLVAVGLVLAGPTARAEPAHKEHWVAQLTSLGTVVGSVSIGLAIAGDDAEGVRGDIGVSLALGGLTLGSTAGHWYVGDELITTGLCIRLSAFAAIPAIMIFDPYLDNPSFTGPVATTAGLVFVTGMIWDHATLPGAVRRHNGDDEFTLLPVFTGNGIALVGAF